MNELEKRKYYNEMSNKFLNGEKIDGLKFRHNSTVKFIWDTNEILGWVVAVDPTTEQPMYTIESENGEGDYEVKENDLTLIDDPYE